MMIPRSAHFPILIAVSLFVFAALLRFILRRREKRPAAVTLPLPTLVYRLLRPEMRRHSLLAFLLPRPFTSRSLDVLVWHDYLRFLDVPPPKSLMG